jgi:uncharacterized membrane protein YkgB
MVSLDTIDRWILRIMKRIGVPILRYAIAIIFIWFGMLKPFGLSPVQDLVEHTVYFMDPKTFVPILGWWEVAIGVCFLYRPLVRVGIPLLFLQLPGTFMPLVLLPEVCFTKFPVGLTVEGQYIIKNLIIIGSALVIGGTLEPLRAVPSAKPAAGAR